jgi:adenylylsulfate kinase
MNDAPRQKSTNTVWHHATITRHHREARNRHKSAILWFTGFSGSGKSTLAHAIEEKLYELGCNTYVCDGDNIRHGLCGDLGFSPEDRVENIRRVGEVAKLFVDAGVIVLTAFISPYRVDRNRARALVAPEDFVEIYCRCPLQICEERDVKGLYRKARRGEVQDFTGISAPYEEPENPELVIDTGKQQLADCVGEVVQYLTNRGIINTGK